MKYCKWSLSSRFVVGAKSQDKTTKSMNKYFCQQKAGQVLVAGAPWRNQAGYYSDQVQLTSKQKRSRRTCFSFALKEALLVWDLIGRPHRKSDRRKVFCFWAPVELFSGLQKSEESMSELLHCSIAWPLNLLPSWHKQLQLSYCQKVSGTCPPAAT